MPDRSGPTVADLGEFPVIDRATTGRRQPATTLVGPGHDAALVAASDGRVAISTDMLVEGRHFRLDWSTPEQIGRKAAAQNGADIAALGARPRSSSVSGALPALRWMYSTESRPASGEQPSRWAPAWSEATSCRPIR